MIKECGYYCLEQKATYCKPENTEFHNSYDSIEKDMRRQLCNKNMEMYINLFLKLQIERMKKFQP